MPKNKINNNDISINLKKNSGVAEWLERPLPTDDEVREFEARVGEAGLEDEGIIEAPDDEHEEEIEESLNEIYQDDAGRMVDVKKMDIKKRRGILYWLIFLLVFGGGGAAAAYFGYNYFVVSLGTDATALEFSVETKPEVTAGEEFFYTLTYKNLSNVVITDAVIEVSYPDNFIYLDSYPAKQDGDSKTWEIMSIPAQSVNTIKIKGMLLGPEDENGIFLASISYTPANFSSEFRKEASFTTKIQDIGLEIDADYLPTALIGEEHEVNFLVNAKENNYIDNFRVTLEPQENFEALNYSGRESDENLASFTALRPGVWQVEGIGPEDSLLPVRLKFSDKMSGKQDLVFIFEKQIAEGVYREFHRETLVFEVLKSDLNLALIVNGSREDQGVDFGETLNYSIVYNNKGETDLKDVIIMAVMESDYLDWTTLNDPNNGQEKGYSLIWTKNEIEDLAVVEKHEEGTIDFSLRLVESGKVEAGGEYQVKSYAQYDVGRSGEEDGADDEAGDNRSNTVINRINSDLKLNESIRYFSEDNIPVGTGPHPPQVGEETTYKVYWEVRNNLHELNDLTVSVSLPEYVEWGGKERATVGNVNYNSSLHAVIWDAGRMPITVFSADAEFSIKISPGVEDKNKIMVLLPGSTVTATDTATESEIKKQTRAKTTKLEDDEIAGGDGIVE